MRRKTGELHSMKQRQQGSSLEEDIGKEEEDETHDAEYNKNNIYSVRWNVAIREIFFFTHLTDAKVNHLWYFASVDVWNST